MKATLALALALALAVLAGCATGPRPQLAAAGDPFANYYEINGPSVPPPSLYNYDPALMHWYTMPYYNPYQGSDH